MLMKKSATSLDGVFLIEPLVFADPRGFFLESYNQRALVDIGLSAQFVQDNHASSRRNVLRGLHYQIRNAQGKLVRTLIGEIFDVVLDLRRWSPTYGRWEGFLLSDENQVMLWLPPGLAHGYRVISDRAEVLYKVSNYYSPSDE